MKVRMPRWPSAAATVAVMIAAAAATYGALALAGVGGGQAQAPQVSVVPGVLRTSNRDHVAICVRGVGVSAADEAEATAAVGAALAEAVRRPEWVWNVSGLGRPTVDNACPPAPSAYDPVARGHGRIVSIPDNHQVIVYIVPEGDAVLSLAGEAYLRASEEAVCWGDVCEEVTTGLYLSMKQMGEIDLAGVLLRALGLP